MHRNDWPDPIEKDPWIETVIGLFFGAVFLGVAILGSISVWSLWHNHQRSCMCHED